MILIYNFCYFYVISGGNQILIYSEIYFSSFIFHSISKCVTSDKPFLRNWEEELTKWC